MPEGFSHSEPCGRLPQDFITQLFLQIFPSDLCTLFKSCWCKIRRRGRQVEAGQHSREKLKSRTFVAKRNKSFGDLFQCSKEDEQRACTYLLCHLSNIYNLSAWMMFTAYSINTWMKNMNSQSMNTQASTHKSISITWLSHYKTSFTEFIELNL